MNKKIRKDMTVRQEIDFIFSEEYQPACHLSRKDDVKSREAIELIADEIDKMWQVFKAY
jgi:hypothetical protein